MKVLNVNQQQDKEFQIQKFNKKSYCKPQLKSLGKVVETTNGTYGSRVDVTGPGTQP